MAQQQPTQQRKIAGMNMVISNAHQVTTQLVGLLVSCANILAICLSVISVISGFVLFAVLSFPTAWGLWIVAGVMGVMLSILIEGLTIGSLARMRLMGQKIKEIERSIEKERDGIDWAKLPGKKHWWSFGSDERATQERILSEKLERQTRDYRRVRNPARIMATFGCTASALVGGLVYHAMLIDLGLMSLVIGAIAPLVITITFVASESYKDSQEEVMKEGFSGGGLRQAAIKEETDRRLMNAMIGMLFDEKLDDPQTLEVLRARVLQVKLAALDRIQVTTTTVSEEPVASALIPLLPQQAESDNVTVETTTPVQSASHEPEDGQRPLSAVIHEVFDHRLNPAQDNSQDEKLTATLAFLDSYPQLATNWTEDDDVRLAGYLGLDRVASARFWRLKALETWTPKPSTQQKQEIDESGSDGLAVAGIAPAKELAETARGIGQNNLQRITDHLEQHPGASHQQIAEALDLSARTVKRHLSGQQGQGNGQETGASQRLKLVH